LFYIKEGHQQLCQGSVKVVENKCNCKLSYNCLAGHRETDILAGKALEGNGSYCFVTAACFFELGWRMATTISNLISELPEGNCRNHLGHCKVWPRDGRAAKTRLYIRTLLTVIP